MKRRGYILLEALIALFLIASLSAALYPFAAEAVRAVDLMAKRSRIAGEGLYAMDFMTEQLRNALKRGEASSISGNAYSYEAYSWSAEARTYNQSGEAKTKTYRFFLDQEKLKLDVYGMTTQPVTGTTSGKEEYALTCEEGPLFVKNGEGSLAISFSILHRPSGEMMHFRTSLLSYADFYRKGQRYE